MPSFLQTSIVSVLAFVGGALFNFGLSEWSKNVDRKGAERSRSLDLYKIVYPEMFKASRELMEKAVSLFHDTRTYCATLKPDMRGTLRTDARKLVLLAHSLVWLLGPEVEVISRNFEDAIQQSILTSQASDVPQSVVDTLDRSFESLVEAVRRRLHVPEFEALFPAASASPSET